ncbi:MAG TPA: DHA2 family efflux MFS transporter permease subunit [Microbacteriaceae bacterium]|nr:DHA2 family efflux MFS transporter permease subunit [Microbacteriaceae bacterium]
MTSDTSVPGAVSDRRLTLISVVLLLGAITTILDTTIVNVALDHLHTVFHASVADTQWVASGYLLGLAGVIPLTGWASERFGSRSVWIFAVAAFLVGSVLCGFAWDLPSLITFRVLQGIGGGMVLPVTMSMLTQAAGPSRIGRAMVAIMIPAQLAPIFGPVIGGALIDSVGWNWLFFVNVPICIAALVLGALFLPKAARDRRHSLDIAGFLLMTPGLIALAYGISEAGGRNGFAAITAWLPMAIGVILIGIFTVYALRTRRVPLIDVRLFRRRSFGLSSVIVFVGGFSSFAVMFLLPLFYQAARGNSAFTTGLLLIPQGIGTIAFALLNGRLSKRIGTRFIVVGGILLTMLGLVPFTFAGSSGSDVLLLVAQFVQGFGLGATMLPIMTVAFASLAKAEVPRASAAFSVVQRVGAPFGVTVIAVLLQSYLSNAAAAGSAQVVGAFGATFWWIFAFAAVPLVLALFLPGKSRPTESNTATDAAEHVAELVSEV